MTKAVGASKNHQSRLWWTIHQWVGLKLSIFVSFIFLTGTLSVFAHEIDWLFNPDMRVNAATVEPEVNWVAIAQGVADYAPDADLRSMSAPISDGFAATAFAAVPGGEDRIYVHPTTGEVLGKASGLNFQLTIRSIHRSLFLRTEFGLPIVTSLSMVLFASLVTSLLIYKKWWMGFFKPIRRRDARTFFGDFHRLAGLWSLWFIGLLIATGSWYLLESLGAGAPNAPQLWHDQIELTPEEIAADLPAALEAAKEAVPGMRIEVIEFPTHYIGAYRMGGQYEAILVRPRANKIWVNPGTKSVELFVDARSLNALQRISEAVDPLHFGTFGGLWTKIIWLIFGVLMTSLSLSGVTIFALRILKHQKSAPTLRSSVITIGRGIGWFAIPTAGLVIMSLILFARVLM